MNHEEDSEDESAPTTASEEPTAEEEDVAVLERDDADESVADDAADKNADTELDTDAETDTDTPANESAEAESKANGTAEGDDDNEADESANGEAPTLTLASPGAGGKQPLSDLPLTSVVEAVLFASRVGLSIARLAQCVGKGTRRDDVREAIDELNREYLESGRAFSVVEVDGAFQLMSRAEYAPHLSVLLGREIMAAPRAKKLSGAQLDTISIIAYRQPIGRVAVETVRGVGCGPILRSLIERGLVRVVGREEEVIGHPLLYGTTRQFLTEFGLGSIEQLPMINELRQQTGVEEPLPEPESDEEKEHGEISEAVDDSDDVDDDADVNAGDEDEDDADNDDA